MPTLDMRRPAVQARQDLAFALSQRGLAHAEIAEIIGWSPESDGIRRAIRAGERRAQSNVGRTSARKFGVEIEFNGTPRRPVIDAIAELDNRIETEVERWNHEVRPHWKFTTDGSVNGTGTGEGGLECVSPILEGERGFAELDTVLKGIRQAGGQVDRSCGLHVHHDARDMSAAQLAWMLEFYTNNQTVIDGLLAPSRRSTVGNRWCRPWDGEAKSSMLAAARRPSAEAKRLFAQMNRYRTINVTAYAKYGSIEFRQHQGSLNARKIKAWVRFGQAMMDTAMHSAAAAVPTFSTVPELTNHLVRMGGLPGDVAEYLNDRAEDYAEV